MKLLATLFFSLVMIQSLSAQWVDTKMVRCFGTITNGYIMVGDIASRPNYIRCVPFSFTALTNDIATLQTGKLDLTVYILGTNTLWLDFVSATNSLSARIDAIVPSSGFDNLVGIWGWNSSNETTIVESLMASTAGMWRVSGKYVELNDLTKNDMFWGTNALGEVVVKEMP